MQPPLWNLRISHSVNCANKWDEIGICGYDYYSPVNIISVTDKLMNYILYLSLEIQQCLKVYKNPKKGVSH